MGERIVRLLSGLAATVVFPAVLLRAAVNRRWRQTIGERLGGGKWNEEAWGDRDLVWFHGASVGEIAGLVPVLTALRRERPSLQIVVTTTSFAGREEIRRRRLADRTLIFPFDHPLIVRKVLKLVKPRVVVLAETEIWPNFLFAAKDLGVPVIVMNGRISEYSYPRYLRLKRLFGPLLRSIRLILVQTKADADRYVAVGADESRVIVAGSTKYSNFSPALNAAERAEYAAELGIELSSPVFVAGSVRSGEDEHVLRAFAAARRDIPSLQHIIAPRHPERFERVARLLHIHGIKFRRRSDGKPEGPAEVVLLDTMGELQRAYSLGSFAFVGGTLVDIGGHNPLEPAASRAPVLIGPYRSNVKDIADELEKSGGMFIVKNEDELTYAVSRLAQNPDECLARGARAYEVWKRNSGALETVMPQLQSFLGEEVSEAAAGNE